MKEILDIKEIEFYKERLQSAHRISPNMLRNINLDVIDTQSFVCDEIVVRLVKEVMRTRELTTTEETEYKDIPLTWWDHLKEQFPGWMFKFMSKPDYQIIEVKRVNRIYNVYPNVTELNDAIEHSEQTTIRYTD